MVAVAGSIPALAVADPVRPFVTRTGATGRVLAAFERSAYLETDAGQLIAVLGEVLGRGAFALTLRGAPPLGALRPDDPVAVRSQVLWVGPLEIDVADAEPWDPSLPALAGPADEGLRVLGAHLRAHAPAEGLARLRLVDADGADALVVRARQAVERLRAGLRAGAPAAITGAVADLAGLGPGLTPSGDDVLAGMLLALRLWPEAAGPLGAGVISTLIVGTAALRTGRISRAYLWAARRGHAAEAWHDLVHALPGSPAAVVAAATRILQTGETSGADMLTGFLVAREP